MSCKYVARDHPRVLVGRHNEDCESGGCSGCQPCSEPHCRVCAKEHADGACAACVGEARDDLTAIRDLCRNLPAEVMHRGVESEAMNMLLPAADPEAWGHVTTSVKVGRLPADYLQCDRCNNPWPCERHADGELHPLFVLATWEQVWRDALDHETDEPATIWGAVAYLDKQLTYMAGYEHAPFEDFASDLSRCRNHVESVLHDGEQRETGAPCLYCSLPLLKIYRGRELPWSTAERQVLASEDGWACARCPHDVRWSTVKQYTLAVTEEHRKHADWLTADEMALRTKVKASTVRSWARDDLRLVRKRLDSGRTTYCVEDVQAAARDKGMEVA